MKNNTNIMVNNEVFDKISTALIIKYGSSNWISIYGFLEELSHIINVDFYSLKHIYNGNYNQIQTDDFIKIINYLDIKINIELC